MWRGSMPSRRVEIEDGPDVARGAAASRGQEMGEQARPRLVMTLVCGGIVAIQFSLSSCFELGLLSAMSPPSAESAFVVVAPVLRAAHV